jgi:hypothetical protein
LIAAIARLSLSTVGIVGTARYPLSKTDAPRKFKLSLNFAIPDSSSVQSDRLLQLFRKNDWKNYQIRPSKATAPYAIFAPQRA